MEIRRGDAAAITGAGSGLGEGLAHVCHEAGMRVVVADIQLDEADACGLGDPEGRRRCNRRAGGCLRPPHRSLRWRHAPTMSTGRCACSATTRACRSSSRSSAPRRTTGAGCSAVNVHGVIHGIDAFVPRMRQQDGGALHREHRLDQRLRSVPAADDDGGGGVHHLEVRGGGPLRGAAGRARSPRGSASPCSVRPASARASSRPSATARKALGGPAPASVDQWEGMEPREIGRMLLDAVSEDRLFVFTDTWPRRFIERRHERMMAAFDLLEG